MQTTLQPIYLFADSHLLFWREDGILFLDSVRQLVQSDSPKAAYIGASNGDAPEFYLIFEAAMEGVGIRNCRMIQSGFPAEDEAFLKEADIILLAGGDVERGWNVFCETGIKELVIKRYSEGTVLMGTSAGAVQLGRCGWTERGASHETLMNTFELMPYVIDAHDEKRNWGRLKRAVRLLESSAQGVGIPSGGGLIYYPHQSIEAIKHPAYQVSIERGEIKDALLAPKR